MTTTLGQLGDIGRLRKLTTSTCQSRQSDGSKSANHTEVSAMGGALEATMGR